MVVKRRAPIFDAHQRRLKAGMREITQCVHQPRTAAVNASSQYRAVVTRRTVFVLLAGGVNSVVPSPVVAAPSSAGAEFDDGCHASGYRASEHVRSYYAVCGLREPPC
jgi:hypothetical protein